jgi:hypothetical protein
VVGGQVFNVIVTVGEGQVHIGSRVAIWDRENIELVNLLIIVKEVVFATFNHQLELTGIEDRHYFITLMPWT